MSSGGGDFYGKSTPLLDAYYVQKDTIFNSAELPEFYQNSSVVRPFDFDNDGDLDIFIGGHTITAKFGKPATSFLLENDGGTFKVYKKFDGLGNGMVTDAIWSDFDQDNTTDLILVGEWMPSILIMMVIRITFWAIGEPIPNSMPLRKVR